MPIGTTSTILKLQIIKEVKRTRYPLQQQPTFLNFVNDLLKSIAITAVGILAAKITAGLSTKIALSYGLNHFFTQMIASTVSVATEFTINQISDIKRGSSSVLNTILNLTPVLGEIGKVSRAYKVAKVLKIANKQKIINQLGINNPKNLQQIINQLAGTTPVTKYGTVFSYSKKTSNETLLNHLGYFARKKFQENYGKENIKNLAELLDIEILLRKINPKIAIPTQKINQSFLKKFSLDIKSITNMSNENFYNILNFMQQSGVKSANILSLNALRTEKIFKINFFNHINNFFKTTKQLSPKRHLQRWLKFVKVNKAPKKVMSLKYLDYRIQKFFNEKLNFIKTIRQWVANKEKLFNEKIKASKLGNLWQKWHTDFKILSKKVIKDGITMPLFSQVFSFVQTKETGIPTDVALTIFYRNPKYEPIGPIITTKTKLQQFIMAPSAFKYYMYQSGWAVGWGFNKSSKITYLNALPSSVQIFYKNSLKTWNLIQPILKTIYSEDKKQRLIHKIKSKTKKYKNNAIDWAAISLLGTGQISKIVRNFNKKVIKSSISKQNNSSKTSRLLQKKIKKKITNYSKKFNRSW